MATKVIDRRRIAALAGRELLSAVHSPALYGAAVFLLAFSSVWLFNFGNFVAMNSATLRGYFSVFPMLYILIVPILTMKSWAEERKTGSIELLLTLPFSEWDLVLGKFLAAFALLAGMLALTLPLPLSLLPLGNFDRGVIAAEYLGLLLLGAQALALGLFLSALSKNQAAGFLGTAVVLMATMLAGQLSFSLNLQGPLAGIVNFFSLSFHFESFSRGLLDSRGIVYYLAGTGLFLYLGVQTILLRKWG